MPAQMDSDFNENKRQGIVINHKKSYTNFAGLNQENSLEEMI